MPNQEKHSVDKKTLVIFDFDKTITKVDTMLDLTYKSFRFSKLLGGIKILHKIIFYKLGLCSNVVAKEAFLTYFFGGMDYDKFANLSREYSLNFVDKIIKKEALDKINFYKSQGYKLIIITSGIYEWIEPWATKNGFTKVLASKLEVTNNKITGKLSGANCYGPEKVNRFIAEYGEFENFNTICFGDSKGDWDILKKSNHPFYKKYE